MGGWFDSSWFPMLLAQRPAHRKAQPQVLAGGIFGVKQGGFLFQQLFRKTRPIIGHGGQQRSMFEIKGQLNLMFRAHIQKALIRAACHPYAHIPFRVL